jgi:predicted dehydrogenase
MNKKIRLGILGGGGDSLIGVLHRVASSMFDRYEIIGGVFNPNYKENLSFAKKLGLKESRIYKDFETMVDQESKLNSDERIEVGFSFNSKFSSLSNGKKIT